MKEIAGSLRDPHAVAAIVSALRSAHGDDVARTMLTEGVSLAIVIDAALSLAIKNRDAVRMIVRALESGDFIFTPDTGPVWNLKYFYARPASLDVIDMAIATPNGTMASTAIRLRLA